MNSRGQTQTGSAKNQISNPEQITLLTLKGIQNDRSLLTPLFVKFNNNTMNFPTSCFKQDNNILFLLVVVGSEQGDCSCPKWAAAILQNGNLGGNRPNAFASGSEVKTNVIENLCYNRIQVNKIYFMEYEPCHR
jgi:hypothetical protein